MKKTSKKIFGGILVVMIIATIGAVVASAHPEFFSELTDEQKTDLKELRETLIEEGATCEEIREAMREQLESYGIEMPTREEMLDKKIEQTEQRLEILNRIKELVNENPDITQEEIRDIISEEFELEFPENGKGMMHRPRGRCKGFGTPEFMYEE
jgi:5-bromo-4-chloroindolyl phosphate hydrolysis protein